MSVLRLVLSLGFVTLAGSPGGAQPPAPSWLVASPYDSAVFLQWFDFAPSIDHLVEYKESASVDWLIFPHPVSDIQGILVGNLANGTGFDFRVSTINADGQSAPTTVQAVTPFAGAIHIANNQIISTGQSLATAYNAFPPLTTSQPFSNLMLNSWGDLLIPLVETTTGGYPGAETMSSALANALTHFATPQIDDYTSIVSLNALPGPYLDLQQGTPTYASALACVTQAKLLSLLANKTLIAPVVTTIHGESDEVIGTTVQQYEDYLVEWQSDYEADIRNITGQAEPVRLFTDQVSSWPRLGFATPRIALAQYRAAKNHPDNIILVAPKYILDYADGYHLRNYSERRLGEYYAKVYKHIIIDGESWQPLLPASITISENVINATFHVPVQPIMFDTVAVSGQVNYGFEYNDDSNSASITNVQIIGPDIVEITLSEIPTGANPRLRYAYTGTIGAWSGAQSTEGSARGNLRDSDMTQAFYQDGNVPASMGIYLHNWAMTFDEPITLETVTGEPEPTGIMGLLRIFPNPAHENLILDYSSRNGGTVQFIIRDIMGREVLCQQRAATAYHATYNLALPSLADGIYLVTVVDGTERYQRRLTIEQSSRH